MTAAMLFLTPKEAKMEVESSAKQGPENFDDPPNSRLFLVTSRSTTEEELREKFSEFGEIQAAWMVKDKQTKEPKGVGYVKFAKSSQACFAMEEMHGKVLSEGTKPIKVFIAQSRQSGRHRDVEDEELTRIFVMIPKTFTEEDLKDTFKVYGDIEYCVIIKNRTTGESKGLGYVRYYKPSQAALAIENCDKSYRAILAEPRSKNTAPDDFSGGGMGGGGGGGGGGMGMGGPRMDYSNSGNPPLADQGNYTAMDYRNSETTRSLMLSTRAALTQEQVFSLFDLIPGMEYCELQRDQFGMLKGHALIRYNNLGSSIYAKEKLNGFEYPPGNRLQVYFYDDGESPVSRMSKQYVQAQVMSSGWNGASCSQMMKPQGFSSASSGPRIQTDVNLPSIKSLAPPDSRHKERLFVVFSPSPLPHDVLEDVFCRYGSLIEVHLVPGRKVGYMKYADKQCADEAMAALHGQVVNGVRMKVMLADPPREESHKRPRIY